jgi:hypothetical protein
MMFGGQDPEGDQFIISLSEPLDLSEDPRADMGLGISFGCQTEAECGSVQISQIDVNMTRMTSSAGGQDDGLTENGSLITVGGFGDLNDNPGPFDAPTSFRTDDELYSLLPFVMSGDTQIQVDTINPSNDDNIFFGYFITSVPAIVARNPPHAGRSRIGWVNASPRAFATTTATPSNRQVDFEIVAAASGSWASTSPTPAETPRSPTWARWKVPTSSSPDDRQQQRPWSRTG